jgi:hypothetical protein
VKVHRVFVLLSLVLVATVLFSNSALAQTSFGQISGHVDDATGALVPGVTVTITEQSTHVVRTFTGDANGFYIATNLPIGIYTITVSHTGFNTAEQRDVAIVADAKITANFTLSIGTATESVQVTSAGVETLNATSGEVSRTIDTKQVENLALNGRNYTQLMTLVPGAVVTNPDIFAVTTSLASNNQTINGNRSDSNNLTVDGAFNQVAGSNGSLMNIVGPDFIQEVRIDTSNASAEFGRTSGPSFNIVTKSGTNAFHGGAFYLMRNNYLDAHNYFVRTPKTTQLIFNDWGGYVGGPIIKDKLFFFAGQEWKRLRQQANATRFTVPTTAMLNGDFSAVCTGASGTFNGNGVCSKASGQLYKPGTTTPIPNNNIAALMTPDGKATANVYKAMIGLGLSYTDGGLPSNNLTLAPSNPLNFYQTLIRLDYVINQKHLVYGRWIHDSNVLTDPYGTFSATGVLPTTPTIRSRPGQSYLVSHTWTIRPNLVNQATANASWASQHIPPTGNFWQRDAYGFQFAKLYPGAGRFPNGIPHISITSYAPMQGPTFSLISPTTDIEVGDTLSWIKGNHLFKFGAVFIRDRVDQNGRPEYLGNINYNVTGCSGTGSTANSTCYALADAFTGNFNSYQESSGDPIGHFRFTQPEAFAQDTWKATRTLSLEYGVRWQLITPFYTQANNISNFDPNVYNPSQAVTLKADGSIDPTKGGNPYNGLVRVGTIPSDQVSRVPNVNTSLYPLIPIANPRTLYIMHGAFGPRFGFAYNPETNTVIRGGVGGFYFRPQGNTIFSQLNLPPFLSNTEFDFGNLSNISGGAPNNSALQGTVTGIDPRLKNPWVYQYSLGVQRQLPKQMFLEVNYVGNVARHQIRQPNINYPDLAQTGAANANKPNFYNPYKGFTAINQYLGDSNYNYHSLQVYAAKRTGWLTFTFGYTYSKNLGDSTSNNGGTGQLENWRDLHYNYGPTSIDRRHALVATYILQLPTFAGHNLLIREVAGGWQLSGVTRLQSGAYYNVTSATAVSTRRADQLPGVAIYAANRGPNCYVNNGSTACGGAPSAFATPPANRFGNSGVGSILAPGFAQTDMSAAKFFPLYRESVRLKFQFDAFNVLNRTNFSGFNATSTSSNFGTITTAYPPRQLQLSAKVLF